MLSSRTQLKWLPRDALSGEPLPQQEQSKGEGGMQLWADGFTILSRLGIPDHSNLYGSTLTNYVQLEWGPNAENFDSQTPTYPHKQSAMNISANREVLAVFQGNCVG